MSQSVISLPRWIDITNQVTWHANVFKENNEPARGLFYNPASHTVMGYFRLDNAANNANPFTGLPQKYYPIATMRFAGICTKDSSAGDISDHFLQLTINTSGEAKIQYTLDQIHYRVICNFTYPCA